MKNQDVNKLLADPNNPLTENLLDICSIAFFATTEEIKRLEKRLNKHPNDDELKEMIANHLKDLKAIGNTWEIVNLNGNFSFNEQVNKFINSLPSYMQELA